MTKDSKYTDRCLEYLRVKPKYRVKSSTSSGSFVTSLQHRLTHSSRIHDPETSYNEHRLPQNPLQDTIYGVHCPILQLWKTHSEQLRCCDCVDHCLWSTIGCEVSNWCMCFLDINETAGVFINQHLPIFELKSESLTAMARYTQDQNYRNGRSRRSGQQHAHGRGDGYNTQHGQDEHVALDQQIPRASIHIHYVITFDFFRRSSHAVEQFSAT